MKIFLDTDFLYNFFVTTQENHHLVLQKMQTMDLDQVIILKLVLYELATVLSHKENQQIATSSIKAIQDSNISAYEITHDDEQLIWDEFNNQTKKGISWVDCANLVIAKKYKAKVASLDKFYKQWLWQEIYK